jgi:preprotein translocase SecE subunit
MAKSATATGYTEESSLGGRLMSAPERFKNFLGDVRTEMKHVSKPSYKEVRGTTIVVIITVALFGLFFYVVDLAFSRAVDWVFHRFV